MTRQIIIATGNDGKMKEFREILSELPVLLTSLKDHWNPPPDIIETGQTFYENARIKADWVFNRTGIWALADDSGLEVDALHGEPGVLSARYAGAGAGSEANNAKLLKALEKVYGMRRTARFRCVLVLKTGMDEYYTFDGVCDGVIAESPRGEKGFGYDPLFIPHGYDRSFAEIDASVKNTISHRGKALQRLGEELHGLI